MRWMLVFIVLVCGQASATDWIDLYDGTRGGGSLDGWVMTGPGKFTVDEDGSLRTHGGMGLFYYAERQFEDFELEVEWKVAQRAANSGIFVRFPEAADPWDAVNQGYEIQIDDSQTGKYRTAGIYSFAAPAESEANPPGEWNTFLIRVRGQQYEVFLNGERVTDFAGSRSARGYVGLQNHDDNSVTWFRRVRARELEPDVSVVPRLAQAMQQVGETIRVLTVTATHGFRHTAAIEKAREVLTAVNDTTEFDFVFTENLDDLNDQTLSSVDVLFFLNATLRVDEPEVVQEGGALTFRPGDFRNFSVAINAGERDINGRIALSGSGQALTGLADFEAGSGVSAMRDIRLDGNLLTMVWDAGGPIGQVVAQVELTEEGFSGTFTSEEFELPIKGVDTPVADQASWNVQDPVTAEHRDAVLTFLGNGGGFAGAHAALDALYGWRAYRDIVGGGLFASHPWTQPVTVDVEDADHPVVQHLGDELAIRDEIYVLDANPRWSSHVLMSLDTESAVIEQGPADGARNDFPISWLRRYGEGRVFITKLGHFPDVWTNPAFLQHLLQGLRAAAGRLEVDFGGRRVKETIAEGVWPDDIAVDERGHVWIAELRGKIHRYDAENETTTLIAELPTTDPTKIEHGLLGIEVDPDFYNDSPYVYLYYTEDDTFINTLSRFVFRDGVIDLGSEEVLLRVPTEPQCCHQAGDIEWGHDATLYLSTGDTGMSETRPDWELSEDAIERYRSENDLKDIHWSRLVDSERSAQNLQDLRGKILRINRDGTIPHDNPFFGQPGVRWEIYAYGLRNPYRFKIHPDTGDLYIGVVGPDARFDYDEYNVSRGGGENFGWPRSIGKLFYNNWGPEDIPNYTPPLWEYTYATGGRSATVGPFYFHDGKAGFPNIFQGKLFVYDWARRWIKWADVEERTFSNDREADVRNDALEADIPALRLTNIRDFDQLTSTAPISMELGPDGSVFVAEFDGFWDAGPNSNVSRYRWVYDGSEVPDPVDEVSFASDGERIYQTRCASCHQEDGAGVAGVFPPLVDTDWVTGNVPRLIDVVLHGLSGAIEVNGQSYTGTMAPWKETLSDEDVADVLTYIRTSWGNQATTVNPGEVRARR